MFDDEGPVPIVTLINGENGIKVFKKDSMKESFDGFSYGSLLQIAMKSISLLMGEHTYQDGDGNINDIKYFGILPFPDLKMDGLTYFFLIPDESARGSARATTITILVNEMNKNFFYDYMNELRHLITSHTKVADHMLTVNEFSDLALNLLKEINKFIDQMSFPLQLKRSVKIVFAGLDGAGKTSMIYGLEKKYSKLIEVRPTQGVSRTQSTLFGLTVSTWDLGGQERYRHKYIEKSELYLFQVDLIFYLLDITDEKRYDESLVYFFQILEILRGFGDYPPIIFCFHKMDPDRADITKLREKINELKIKIRSKASGFPLKFFETTIFEPFSLINAFSYGLVVLNPNREIFLIQLERFAKLLNAKSVLLLNEKGLIISDYSSDEFVGNIFKLSAPHFATLYSNFSRFVTYSSKKAIYMLEDNIVCFYALDIKDNKIYMMIFLDYKTSIEDIDEKIDDFRVKIQDLFETFL
ncbi:MAG: ADP-ribosylation factor-like protein [Promethearchaeota archaeon]